MPPALRRAEACALAAVPGCALGAWVLALALIGCSFDAGPLEQRRCTVASGCPAGELCQEGFCQRVAPEDDGGLCQRDDQCDDGRRCNGVEVCRPGAPMADRFGCAPGAPPDVDDRVACTRDLCDALTDEILHIPTAQCECVEDDDCPGSQRSCQESFCDAFVCALRPAPEGSGCDDGVACTDGDTCDGEGACVGSADDALCDDGAFCNGAETCAPEAPNANGDGCVAGAPPALELPDLSACAVAVCDEGLDAVVADETGCGCLSDADCGGPCVVEGACVEGRCERTLAAAGESCDDGDGVACTAGRCDEGGRCVATPDDGLCAATCRQDAACEPGRPDAGFDGCTFEEVGPSVCALSCGVDVTGVCEGGACVVDRGLVQTEAGVGSPRCVDGVDNDCDGAIDEADPGCGVPDALEVFAPAVAPVGLHTGGALIELVPSRGGVELPDQSAQLVCEGRHLGPGRSFEAADALEGFEGDPLVTAWGPDGRATVQLGEHVRAGQGLGGGSPLRGLLLCDGYGVSLGPYEMPPASGDVRTFILSVSAASPSPPTQGLGEAGRLVVSYRTNNATLDGRFMPLLVLDGEDRDEARYEFAIRNGSGIGRVEVRLDVLDPQGEGACAWVGRVQLYEVLNPTAGVRRVVWDVGGIGRVAAETFPPAPADYPRTFFGLDPLAEHALSLESIAATTPSAGVTWRATAGGEPVSSFLEWPRITRETLHGPGAPLMLDLNMALPAGDSGRGEALHVTVSADGGQRRRKVASTPGQSGMPPHLTVPYTYAERVMAVLPPEAWPLGPLRVRFEMTPLVDGAARAWLDSLYLHFHQSQVEREVTIAAARVEAGQARHEVAIRSARPGPVEVRCYWQEPTGDLRPTVAGAPRVVTFQ